jgi:gliding motility-associated-like protein
MTCEPTKKQYLPKIILFMTPSTLIARFWLVHVFCLIGQQLFAQLVINEISTSNSTQAADNFGEFEDWIELYNAGPNALNIGGYYLSDEAANPTQWQIPAGITIPAGGFRVIWCSNRDGLFGNSLHSNFKLTQMRQEDVVLSDPSGTVIDQFPLTTPTRRNHSRGRQTNGAANWRFFATPTPGASNNTQTAYLSYVPKVVFDAPAGFYPLPGVAVQLSCADPNAEIRYTLDGSEPTATSTLYQGTLFITTTQCVRARAFVPNGPYLGSFTETNTYFVDVSHTLPVVSLAGNFNGLFAGGAGGEIRNAFEFFDVAQQQQFEMEGDMRGHGNDSWNFDQKGIRFYTRDQYGYENNIEYPLFPTSPRDEYDVVILKAAGSDSYPGADNYWNLPSCHVRDAFSQTLAEEGNLHLDLRRLQHCIVYINGNYWGIYEMRERVDADYTDYYYSQEEPDVDMLKYWGGLDIEYGSDTAYYNLVDFINNSPMTDPANYAYVSARMDLMSLIDYFMINTYTVNSDWLNWNTMWWRGREAPGVPWKYVLWDMDNTFDLGQNYTGLPTTDYDNDPCATDNAFPNSPTVTHSQVFNRLLDNPDFFSMYISRYADLLNTVFSCDNMIVHLDSLLAILTPEMPQQVARWGGTMQEWQTNVQYLRNQILGRCNFINGGIVDCYEPTVNGPHTVTVLVDPPLSGNVVFNTLTLQNYPWSGTYFGGVDIDLAAVANAGWMFDYWELSQHAVSPSALDPIGSTVLQAPDTIIAHFRTLGVSVSPNAPSLCAGESVTLRATGGNGFVWTLVDDPAIIGTGDSLLVAPQQTTTYVVGNALGTDTVTVTVTPLPNPALPTNTTVCSGENVLLDPAVAGAAYLWQDGSTSAVYPVVASGNYAVTATLNGCTASASAQVTVNPRPTVSLGETYTFCAGESQLLDATNAGASYSWQDGSTASTFVATQSGLYFVEVLLNGCSERDSATVSVLPVPVVDLGADVTRCEGSPVLFDATFAGATYRWQDGSTAATFVPVASGLYLVELELNGCRSADSVAVLFTPVPAVDLGQDRVTCADAPISLDAGNTGATYLWQNGETTAQVQALASGLYSVAVDLNGCVDSDTVQVTVNPLPVVELGQDSVFCEGETIALDVRTTGAAYLWQDGSTDGTFVVSQAGLYMVTVTLANCSASDEVTYGVELCADCESAVPNAFTPNGDGRNDVFRPLLSNCSDISGFRLVVFDRWGNEVFQTNDPQAGWSGADAPREVYLWFLRYEATRDGQVVRVEKQGDVTLVR